MLEEKLLDLAKDLSIGDIVKIVKYIKTYFILPEDAKLEHFIKGIRRLKQMFELGEGDEITPQILRLTEYHRCGCPDSLDFEEATNDYNRFLPGMTLKWGVSSYVNSLSKDDQIAIFTSVYNDISKICNINFERTTNLNNANLVIHSSNRGNGLGGANGTLAYAYLASKRDFTGQLDLVLDLAEKWIKSSNSGPGIILSHVFSHETLHNLGLKHSNVKTSLMAPYYSANICCPVQNDDISRLVKLYGPPKNSPLPPTAPDVPSIPNPVPTDELRLNQVILTSNIEGKDYNSNLWIPNLTKIQAGGFRISKIGE